MRLFLAVLLVVVILGALAVLWRHKTGAGRSNPDGEREVKSSEACYKPYVPFMTQTPDDLAQFVAQLSQKTGLARTEQTFPVDQESIQRAARAFQEAASEVFAFHLALDDADVTQLDRLANTHLIDERLRKFFQGDDAREGLSEDEERMLDEAMAEIRVPNEPLLYYCMGAFWGEWLVKHKQAAWVLYAPLRSVQVFPDMLHMFGTVCIHPFSQVNKKLGDPPGDKLAFKATWLDTQKKLFRPFPLTASIDDGTAAGFALLPEEARQAFAKEEAGDSRGALELYEQALRTAPDNARLLFLASQMALQLGDEEKAEAFLSAALRREPKHPLLNHNLAVVCAMQGQTEGLDRAVELLELALATDPRYSRAHITLASFLMDKGLPDQALEHAQWVVDNDPQLRDEAHELIEAFKEGE